MPRWQLLIRTLLLVVSLSTAANAQVPAAAPVPNSSPAYPPPNYPPPNYPPPNYPPPNYPPPNYPRPNLAAPQLAVPPAQPFDPYTLPSTAPPTLPPALSPTAPPPAFPYTMPGQAPVVPAYPSVLSPSVGTARRGFYGGFEAAVLEPKLGSLGIAQLLIPILIPQNQADAFNLISHSTDYDLTFSPRVWGGFMGQKGFGGRAQWWYFDAESKTNQLSIDDLDASLRSSLKYNIFDFEATQMGALQTWQFELGGGVRYGKIDQSLDAILVDPMDRAEISIFERFEGVGPTVSFAAKRPIGNWEGLTFVGKTRYSILFGDADLDSSISDTMIDLPDLNLIQISDTTLTSWEISVGAVWSRILPGGAVFNLGGYLEGQVWNPDNHGFFGPTFHVSISR